MEQSSIKKIGFLEEAPGQKSWTRLAATYCFTLSGFLIIFGTLKSTPIDYTLVITLLSTASGLKLIQKPMEGKGDDGHDRKDENNVQQ